MMKSGKLQKILYAALILVLLAGLTVSFLFNPYNRMSVEAKQSFLSIDVGDNLSAPDSPELSDDNGLNKKIYYTDAQNQKQFVDNSWQVAALPWNWQMTHDDYTVRVKNLITDGQVIEFGRDGETVYLQPSNLQWTNDLGQIQLISIPTNTSTTVDSKATDLTSSRTNNEGFIQWDDAYGSGINFQWQCTQGV